MLEIKETAIEDLDNIRRLWADGDVMRYFGFPDGMHETEESMKKWFSELVLQRPVCNQYSIYEDGIFCGEVNYQIDTEHHNFGTVDVKLFKSARGKGIASKAITFAVEKVLENGASNVWVFPNALNLKAIAMYERLGFVRRDMPEYLIEQGNDPASRVYMEFEKR